MMAKVTVTADKIATGLGNPHRVSRTTSGANKNATSTASATGSRTSLAM